MTLHPIEDTLARLAGVDEHFRSQLLTKPDAQAGWRSAAEITMAGTPHLDGILAHVALRYKVITRPPAVSLWFGQYAFGVMTVAIACYLVEQRVPDLTSANVQVRFDGDGNPAAFAWCGRSFAALPEDPAAHHPDCMVFSSRKALREHLLNQIITHLTPLVEALRVLSSFGRPALWALAADSSASAFTWIAELLGDTALGLEEARAFSAAPSLLHRKRDFIPVEHCGLTYTMLDRVSCCLYFKVEDGDYCSTCPHRPPEERVGMIKNWLEKQAAEQ